MYSNTTYVNVKYSAGVRAGKYRWRIQIQPMLMLNWNKTKGNEITYNIQIQPMLMLNVVLLCIALAMPKEFKYNLC